ncbi:MAG TPA: lamin tail domain-containing protein [Myxococcales bacterium]|jgi:hypothetical protein
MTRLFARSLLLATLVGLAGCSLIIDGDTKCSTEKDCKGGAVCLDGVCVQAEPPDASVVVPPDAGAPDAGPVGLVLVATAPTTGKAGADLKLTVTAQDPSGATLAGYTGTVEITSSDVEATLPAKYAFLATDNGTHEFTVVLRTAGSQTVTATDTAVSAAGRATVAVAGAEAASLTVEGLVSPFTAGTKGSVIVTAKDTFGNVAAGYLGTVKLTSDDTAAVLPADYAFVAADNGTHTFTGGVELRTSGTRSVTATDAAASISGKQSSITVVAAAGASLTVAGIKSPVDAGEATGVAVSAFDAFHNFAIEYTGRIHFTSTDPKAMLPADYQFVASDRGQKVFPNGVTLRTPGKVNVVATDLADDTIAGAQNDIDVQVGPAARLAFVQSPLGAQLGVAMPAVQVAVQDAAGNTVTTSTAEVTIAKGQGPALATLGGDLQNPAVGGIATFADLTLDLEGTGFTLKATSGTLASAESAPFDVNNCALGYTGPTCADCVPSYHHPAGQPTVCSDGCHDPAPSCPTQPAKKCEGRDSVTFQTSGACAADSAAPFYKCNYPEVSRVHCADSGQVCDVATGSCVVSPCDTNPCTVKAAECSADLTTLQTYAVECTPVTTTTRTCTDKPQAPVVCTDGPLVCLAGACTAVPVPVANDLLITEVLDDSSTNLATAKWFEVRNLAGQQLDLAGLKIEEVSGAKSFTLPTTPQVVSGAGRYVVAGSLDPAQNGGVTTANAAWTGAFTIPAGAGHLRILAGATVLEELTWDATFPHGKGVAMNLSSRALVKGANAHAWFWCPATSYVSGSAGDKGTPGLANDACGKPVPSITWCASQAIDQPVLPASPTHAYGQVRGGGLTDFNTTGNDLNPLLVGEFGYGTVANSTGWTWAAATPNPTWAPTNSTDDEYRAGVTFATAATYHWAFRFGLKDPATGTVTAWTYCGATDVVAEPTVGPWATQAVCATGYAGSDCSQCATGYHQPASAPATCVDACHDPDPCAVAKAPECRSNTSVTFSATGTCTTNGTGPDYYSCSYTETPTPCGDTGKFCKTATGLCADPCFDDPCPGKASECLADGLTRQPYGVSCTPVDATTRTCGNPAQATVDCAATGAVCTAGACVTVPAPVAGDLLITEVLANPTAGSGDEAKWIEITNLSNHSINLAGLTFEETSGTFSLPAGLQLVAAYDRYVIGGSANTAVNGGVVVDAVWTAPFTIGGTAGHVRILSGTTVLEELTWDSSFPTASGIAMNLSSQALQKGTNAHKWFWCGADAFISGTTGDKGTPGGANFDCGKPAPSLFWCNAQAIDVPVTATVETHAYGRAYGDGLTNFNTGGDDLSPLLVGEFGFAPSTDNDATGVGWTWMAATPNYPAYAPTVSPDTNNDEFMRAVTFAANGTYNWAFRFAMKDPVTLVQGPWMYCDALNKVADPLVGPWRTQAVPSP